MSRQTVRPGGTIDVLTPDEFVKLIPRAEEVTRMRVSSSILLDASGNGDDEIYKVPVGYEFALRRASFSLSGSVPTDPNTGNVALNAAGKFIAYMRSGMLIEYAQPFYGAAIQVPGVQSWGDQQGPAAANGEVLGVLVKGLTASASLSVYIEGLLRRPANNQG